MSQLRFCTLFDSNYLTRGMAMYDSLINSGESFILYIVCFDNPSFQLLKNLNLKYIILIRLEDFETEELLKIKQKRSFREYCWTCTPFVIRYVLERFKLEEVTYLDADLYFFQKPSILLKEFYESGCSALITEHRYTPEYDQCSTSGIYCVQFITFKSDETGLHILQWWQDRCLEWCYARYENGKFGDQKYLDNWPQMFKGVHVLKHLGGGVAPWNIQQYKLTEGPCINGYPVVFYHYHGLKWYYNDNFRLSTYKLPEEAKTLIYQPYLDNLKKQLGLLRTMDVNFNKGQVSYQVDWKRPLRYLKRKIKGIKHAI